MGNASLELDKTMGPRPANSIRDRSLIDGFTKVRMYGCNLILRQPSLRNALQGGSDHVSYPYQWRAGVGPVGICWARMSRLVTLGTALTYKLPRKGHGLELDSAPSCPVVLGFR